MVLKPYCPHLRVLSQVSPPPEIDNLETEQRKHMHSFLIPAMGAVTLIAISSLGLMRKGNSVYLRRCLFAFCLMSLTQGALIIGGALNASSMVTSLLQLLLAGLSLQGMYLVSAEMVERARFERRLSLAVVQPEAPEELPAVAQQLVEQLAAPLEAHQEIANGRHAVENSALVTTPTSMEDLEKSTLRATADLLLLLGALSASSDQPSPNVTVKKYLAPSRPKTSVPRTSAVA